MKKWFSIFCILHAISSFACVVTDDLQQQVILDHPARRILSLAPDLTENLFAIGAGAQIVGVVAGSDFPLDAKKLPQVATYHSIDREKILQLHPDLIVAWSDAKYISQLKKLHIPLYLSHPTKLTDIPQTLERLGCLTGNEKQASIVANDFLKRYAALSERYKNKKKFSLFYQIWFNPLLTITKKSWINDIILFCNGQNIFDELHGIAPRVNLEAVMVADPEIILASDADRDFKQHWLPHKTMRAVKNQNLYSIHADLVERASVRILDGVEEICDIISQSTEPRP